MSGVTRVLLWRHGETAWNREGRYQGHRDIPLNERGKAQARQLAEYLAAIPIDVAIASPLSRALDTAAAIMRRQKMTAMLYAERQSAATACGGESVHASEAAHELEALEGVPLPVNIEIEPGFREIGHGEWEGRLAAELPASLRDAWSQSPHKVQWPGGGESIEQVQARTVEAFRRVVARHEGKTILIGAHDAVNKALVLWAVRSPLDRFWAFKQDSACLNVLDVTRDEAGEPAVSISLLNSVAHTGHLFAELVHKAL